MNVGLNIGNGYTKAHDGRGTVVFPSVVGPAVQLAFQSRLQEQHVNDIILQTGERSWFVGELAIRQSPDPIPLRGRKRDKEMTRVLALTAFYRLGIPSNTALQIVTGLPIDWYQRGDRREMVEALTGDHRAIVNGEPYRWIVDSVEVFPEPFGTIAYEALRLGGDPQILSKPVAVVDIGTTTVNLALFEAMEYIDAKSHSYEIGMAQAYELVARECAERYEIELDATEAEQAFRQGYIEVRGKVEDISRICDRARASVRDSVKGRGTSLWGDAGTIYRVPLTGGGAYPLERELVAVWQQARIVPNAQTANAIGYYLYGSLS